VAADHGEHRSRAGAAADFGQHPARLTAARSVLAEIDVNSANSMATVGMWRTNAAARKRSTA